MKQNTPWEQLARYFAGELTMEECQQMKSWIKADPEREQQIQKLHAIWEESGAVPYELDIDEAWQTLSGNMDKLEQKEWQAENILAGLYMYGQEVRQIRPNNKEIRRPDRMVHRMFIIAVAAVILLAAGLFTYFNYDFGSSQTAEIARKQLTAGEGERTTYLLNDGSRVILHAGSRLEVPVQYNVDNRELFLEGEAYFEVTHDVTKPFIVHSGRAYTRVLGTRFLVQAWNEAGREVEVVVAEGKVAFGGSGPQSEATKEVILTKNQKGSLTEDRGPVITDNADLGWYLGWTEGRLVFDNRPFGEIIPRLERWYVLDIETEDGRIREKKLTAEIDYSQPMGEVLKGIALSLDLEFEKEGRSVIFRFKDQDG